MGLINQRIKKHFDDMSIDRDERLASDYILDYEQKIRQKAVIKLLNPQKKEVILDLGCGNGRDVIEIVKYGSKVYGIDLSEGMIHDARSKKIPNAKFYIGDATKLPFNDNFFDKITCSEVIEHIPKYDKVIGECRRVLKKRGILVITTPNMNSMYGFTKTLFKYGKLFFPREKKKSHPYDVWKTQKEIIKVLRYYNFSIKQKLGICYIPGQLSYYLSDSKKKKLVALTGRIESYLSRNFTAYGYNIGVSSRCNK